MCPALRCVQRSARQNIARGRRVLSIVARASASSAGATTHSPIQPKAATVASSRCAIVHSLRSQRPQCSGRTQALRAFEERSGRAQQGPTPSRVMTTGRRRAARQVEHGSDRVCSMIEDGPRSTVLRSLAPREGQERLVP